MRARLADGSLPLARALRRIEVGVEREPGVIPAHAGSLAVDHLAGLTARVTPAPAGSVLSPWASWWPASHPRLRGLYSVVKSSKTITVESLPLARALPLSLAVAGREDRVIPARAGSTLCDLVILARFA